MFKFKIEHDRTIYTNASQSVVWSNKHHAPGSIEVTNSIPVTGGSVGPTMDINIHWIGSFLCEVLSVINYENESNVIA